MSTDFFVSVHSATPVLLKVCIITAETDHAGRSAEYTEMRLFASRQRKEQEYIKCQTAAGSLFGLYPEQWFSG